ncbi:MAG: biopolymer transporter ExbD [Deferribacteres bacterium]|nr:biopolymer transporter ExbD [candidate division KSB1 bacterium]MCB9501864.1 biopolymer transporter ExbD [Deferribacteres bacterium]
MGNKTMMLRLIDVALIILLGFIAISRLKTEYIDLPAAGNAEPKTDRTATATLYIYKSYYDYEVEGRKRRARSTDELERVLRGSKSSLLQSRTKLIVSIEPHKSSIMQNLVDVLDICQRNQIEKNFDYDRIN